MLTNQPKRTIFRTTPAAYYAKMNHLTKHFRNFGSFIEVILQLNNEQPAIRGTPLNRDCSSPIRS